MTNRYSYGYKKSYNSKYFYNKSIVDTPKRV